MRARMVASVCASAAVAVAVATVGTASARAPRVCTWGGTALSPTGKNYISGGLTNNPSPRPVHFRATGPLGGQCEGSFVFDGTMDAGASCTYITFQARAFGIPGVTRVVGKAVAGVAPARLYDSRGEVVGSENANFLSDPAIVSECASPDGVTRNPFSSLIVLFGD